jgi:phosphoribosylformylglycinamidine synthase
MGLVIGQKDIDTYKIRQRARPMYQVGDVTGDHRFTFESKTTGAKPMDFALEDFCSPKVVMTDTTIDKIYRFKLFDKISTIWSKYSIRSSGL